MRIYYNIDIRYTIQNGKNSYWKNHKCHLADNN